MPRRTRLVKVGKITARIRRERAPGEDDGRCYWQGYVLEKRKRRTVWKGWATREELERELGALISAGVPLPQPKKEDSSEILTVLDLCRAWLAEQEDRATSDELRPKSLAAYKQSVRRIKMDAIANVSLERIDQDTMTAWKHRRLRAASSNTVVAEYKTLRGAWKFGLERDAVPARALPAVPITTKPVRPKVTPEVAEIRKLLRHVDGWVRVALWLQFATGARIGEIAGIRWKHVDFELARPESEREPTIFLELGKRGPRTVPISNQCAAILAALEPKRPEAYVTSMQPSTVRRMHTRLADACKRLGIPKFTSHGIRRLVVETFSDQRVDVRTAADLLGNSPQTIWEYYKHTTPKSARAAMRLAELGYLPAETGQVLDLEEERKKR